MDGIEAWREVRLASAFVGEHRRRVQGVAAGLLRQDMHTPLRGRTTRSRPAAPCFPRRLDRGLLSIHDLSSFFGILTKIP